MAGVERNLVTSRPRHLHITVDALHVGHGIPRADYRFTMTGGEGAILILPDDVIVSELQNNEQPEIKQIRERAARCTLHWCGFASESPSICL